ncbi:unnamed protein product [Rotaria magnacalcarata]|uniref:Uncharacterized protein n=1 Tax=Rotaria magnacalcarata TaxID=392030 RepID=A0A816WAJ0_9BILA|nr:unnamed protein product [Rotaria magnacalcarata]CAF1586612.1 unnamed protein product [Rotaria magnacalcarata]CAF2109733.1 unnamed protein product [Rotaria magnacalcarata]CAF2133832.1 unnamed protein product [Rotaria magnacalcarata]
MCFTSTKNIDPKPSKEVQDLQDELSLSNNEWTQAFKDLNEKVVKAEENSKKLEENNKKLEESHSADIKYIVSLLVNEMIEKVNGENVDGEKNNAKQKYKSDSFDQHGSKKTRFE